jgi:hypothetical protein
LGHSPTERDHIEEWPRPDYGVDQVHPRRLTGVDPPDREVGNKVIVQEADQAEGVRDGVFFRGNVV